MSHPRNLAVAVQATPDSRFRWLILECRSGTQQWLAIAQAPRAHREWMDALNGGVDQLLRRTADGRIGPQQADEDEDADPVG